MPGESSTKKNEEVRDPRRGSRKKVSGKAQVSSYTRTRKNKKKGGRGKGLGSGDKVLMLGRRRRLAEKKNSSGVLVGKAGPRAGKKVTYRDQGKKETQRATTASHVWKNP